MGRLGANIAIARALDMSPSEVETVKRSLSFTGVGEVPDGFTEEQLATAREASRKQLQTFARELVSSLQFYQNQPGSLGIGEIALTGGTAHLPGLGAELERLIGVPVRVVDPLSRFTVSKKVPSASRSARSRSRSASGSRTDARGQPAPSRRGERSFEANRGVVFGGVGGAALATAVLASMMISAGGHEQQAGGAGRGSGEIAAIPACR